LLTVHVACRLDCVGYSSCEDEGGLGFPSATQIGPNAMHADAVKGEKSLYFGSPLSTVSPLSVHFLPQPRSPYINACMSKTQRKSSALRITSSRSKVCLNAVRADAKPEKGVFGFERPATFLSAVRSNGMQAKAKSAEKVSGCEGNPH
jgi:hypothetical protein